MLVLRQTALWVVAAIAFCNMSLAQTTTHLSDQKDVTVKPDTTTKSSRVDAKTIAPLKDRAGKSSRRSATSPVQSNAGSLSSTGLQKQIPTAIKTNAKAPLTDQGPAIKLNSGSQKLSSRRTRRPARADSKSTRLSDSTLQSSRPARLRSNMNVARKMTPAANGNMTRLGDQSMPLEVKPLAKNIVPNRIKNPAASSRRSETPAYDGIKTTFGDANTQVSDRRTTQPSTTLRPIVANKPKGASAILTDQIQAKSSSPTRIATLPAPVPPTSQPATTSLNMTTLSGANFKSPKSFLSSKQFNFADASKYLKQKQDLPLQEDSLVEKKQAATTKQKPILLPKAQLLSGSKKTPARKVTARTRPSNRVINRRFTDEDEKSISRYLTVKSVDDPIVANPFAEIQQQDDLGLLNESRPAPPIADGMSYSTLTGYYEQAHLATYQAHNFKHRPLYFEEVNLERYGNQLPLQNVISAAHFFTSAGLMPYQLGAKPPNCCVSTLGHKRPGDCVPYQRHRWPRSTKGLFYQGLAITAISL